MDLINWNINLSSKILPCYVTIDFQWKGASEGKRECVLKHEKVESKKMKRGECGEIYRFSFCVLVGDIEVVYLPSNCFILHILYFFKIHNKDDNVVVEESKSLRELGS